MNKLLLICVIAIFLSTCTMSDDEGFSSRPDWVQDMFRGHEGHPAGVPSDWDWYNSPRLRYGINIPKDWSAITAWGQVYADKMEPTPDQDFPLVRVHLKDLRLYIYQNDGTWKLVQNAVSPEGAAFVENFANDENKPADIQNEIGGGISIQAGSGYNFHFWPQGREIVDKNNLKGVFVVCQARLTGTENYETLPKYIMDVGGDYWRDLEAEWKPNGLNNNDIGIGRFKYVTPEWQYFTMHTFSRKAVKDIIFPIE